MSEWYVDSSRQPVDLSTIRDGQGKATKDVFRLVQRDDGVLLATRWARAGTALRAFDVEQAQRVASTSPVPAERTPGSATPSVPSAALVDALALARLDQQGLAGLRKSSGKAAIDFADATIVTQPFDALPTLVVGNLQVAGNRLHYAQSGAITGTNPFAYHGLAENVAVTRPWRLVGGFTVVALGGSSGQFLGVSFADKASTAVGATAPDDLAIGITTTGTIRILRGSNIGGTGVADATPWSVTPGDYQVIIENDTVEVSVTIRHSTDHTRTHTARYPVSGIGAAKAVGRIMMFMADTRGTAGHGIRPWAFTYGSRQPSRTKVIGGYVVEGLAHRDLRRLSTNGTDTWRASIPSSYDPRKPVPLAIHLHPAQSSYATADRPWVHPAEQGMSKALNDAGYIVAASQDGYSLGNNNSDRYGNDVSLAEQKALIDYLRSQFAISEVVLYGVSMGGLTGLNLLARRAVPNIAAAYFIDGGVDLGRLGTSVDPALVQFAAPVRAAYGVASDGSDWDAKTAGHNPMDREGWEFRGVPIRLVSGESDTVAPPAKHVEFLDKIAPYAREASQNLLPGTHTAASHYVPNDLMAFLSRHVA